MPRTTVNHEPLLRSINELGLADLEMLVALHAKPGFSSHGVRWACDKLQKEGYVARLWKHRNPKFRMDRGSARQVFLLTNKGSDRLGLTRETSKNHLARLRWLSNPRTEYRIEHELMVARFYASLMVAERHHSAVLRVGVWHQGKDTAIKADGFRLTPDARLQLVNDAGHRAGWFFLEADTGNERLESDDVSRRTIEQKVKRYGLIDRDDVAASQFGIPGFSVLFLVPRRADKDHISTRERGIFSTIQKAGMLTQHAPKFYRVLSETDVEAALKDPNHYIQNRCLHVILPDGRVQAMSFVPQPVHSTS